MLPIQAENGEYLQVQQAYIRTPEGRAFVAEWLGENKVTKQLEEMEEETQEQVTHCID